MKSPKYPNPYQTASAQGAANQSTAISQQLLNMINQQGPYGSLTYNKSGTNSYYDPMLKKTIHLPQFTQTTKLSPEQQALLAQEQEFDKRSNEIGLQQTGRIGALLSTPFDYNPGEHEKWASGLYENLTGEANQRSSAAMDAKLANMGLMPGSAAYNAEQSRLARDQNYNRNQFRLDSYNTGFNTAQVKRNQPLNEIAALMGGGQIQNPQFGSTPSVGVGGTDIAGLINGQYQSQMANHQNKMGGMFGLGSAALGGWASLSDERAKTNKKEIGALKDGTKLYSYEYKPEVGGQKGLMHIGVMAQQAKRKHPDAVAMGDDGLYRVNYGKIAEELAA